MGVFGVRCFCHGGFWGDWTMELRLDEMGSSEYVLNRDSRLQICG